jgi:hypothetical protein
VNCFPEELHRHSGSFCIRILGAGSITFDGERSNSSNFLALPSKTPLPCHQKLSCFLIENFPALPSKTSPRVIEKLSRLVIETSPLCHQKLSRFVIKTSRLCHRKLSRVVILSAVRRQPNGAEGPHACVQRLRPIQEFPPPLPQRFEPAKVLVWSGNLLFWARFLSTGCCCAYPAELQ